MTSLLKQKKLKLEGIWAKIDFAYPFVGNNADMMKYNLKDPQDTDAAYRITWLGSGGTFGNSEGFNGDFSLRGNTHYSPSAVATLNNQHMVAYAGTDNGSGEYISFGRLYS